MVTHTEILIFHFLLFYILRSPSFKKINAWVTLLSIFIYSIDAVFPTLRPSSYCEWVFHLAILWVLSPGNSYEVSSTSEELQCFSKHELSIHLWLCICELLQMFCNANAYSILKKTPLNSHLYLFFFLCTYWFFFQLLSVSVYHFGVIILSLTLWFCGACYLLVLVTLLEKYVLFVSWSLYSWFLLPSSFSQSPFLSFVPVCIFADLLLDST